MTDNYPKDLISAVWESNLNKVKSLLRKGSCVNCRDEDGRTPLMIAISNNRLEIVHELIKHKADINIKDRDGWTPLIYAVQFNLYKIAKILLNKKIDFTSRDYQWNYDAYHWAIHNKYHRLANLLKSYQLDL